MTFEIIVGSNNETKLLEIEKIMEITARYYDGATFTPAAGIWKGESEKSLKVEVISNRKTLKEYMQTLKEELEQEEIAYKKVRKLKFY